MGALQGLGPHASAAQLPQNSLPQAKACAGITLPLLTGWLLLRSAACLSLASMPVYFVVSTVGVVGLVQLCNCSVTGSLLQPTQSLISP